MDDKLHWLKQIEEECNDQLPPEPSYINDDDDELDYDRLDDIEYVDARLESAGVIVQAPAYLPKCSYQYEPPSVVHEESISYHVPLPPRQVSAFEHVISFIIFLINPFLGLGLMFFELFSLHSMVQNSPTKTYTKQYYEY